MDISEYLNYALKNHLPSKWLWVTSLLGNRPDNTGTDYISVDDGKGYVKVDGKLVKFDAFVKNKAFLRLRDEVTVKADNLASLDKDIKTTVGKLLINYVLIEIPFKGKLSYMKGELSIGKIIDTVRDALSDESISVAMYRKFVVCSTYLTSFNRIVTPSSTEKLLLPPPDLKQFKKKLRSEFDKKYGADWGKDTARVVEYDTELKNHYAEYIKGDASDGIIANKKNKGNSLTKKYLTFSTADAFGQQEHVDESLMDGYPADAKKLAAMFNTSRAASYSRGVETQKGGSVAKSVLRATSSMNIVNNDCGVKRGKHIIIEEHIAEGLLGRYLIVGAKTIKLTKDNIKSYIGKTVTMRSPMYCIEKQPNICSVCAGEKAAGTPNGISLIVMNVSSTLTLSALKKMHNSQISTVRVSLGDMVD